MVEVGEHPLCAGFRLHQLEDGAGLKRKKGEWEPQQMQVRQGGRVLETECEHPRRCHRRRKRRIRNHRNPRPTNLRRLEAQNRRPAGATVLQNMEKREKHPQVQQEENGQAHWNRELPDR